MLLMQQILRIYTFRSALQQTTDSATESGQQEGSWSEKFREILSHCSKRAETCRVGSGLFMCGALPTVLGPNDFMSHED